jgi:hypothetical protein
MICPKRGWFNFDAFAKAPKTPIFEEASGDFACYFAKSCNRKISSSDIGTLFRGFLEISENSHPQ